ncbi:MULTISPECIES: host attachment protein [Rhodomicrobium]|uniref:host attachment protein n=1 Tax=Rhodomicrobium TaxID=1068 RepID=UPI000B4AD12A|nr:MULTISPECIES: host attachment protein [Rhodomicrobium]
MEAIKIKSGEWVLVCDGRKALILENEGDAMFPNLRTKETHEHDVERTSALGADHPGRVHQSEGASRSSVEQTDWHLQAEDDFLGMIARRLDEAVRNEETRSLVIVAAPRALGFLRTAFSPAVQQAIKTEIAKDYVKMPIHEIEKFLTQQG